MEAADFDGDSDIDLYVAHSAATAVYISNNAGTFAVTTNATGGSPSVICSADFDEDGDIDIVGKSGVVITATPITFIQNQDENIRQCHYSARKRTGLFPNIIAFPVRQSHF